MAERVPAAGGGASATPRSRNVVAATGTGGSGTNITASMIEDAMVEAVLQCGREGITDPDTILARKLQARADITGG